MCQRAGLPSCHRQRPGPCQLIVFPSSASSPLRSAVAAQLASRLRRPVGLILGCGVDEHGEAGLGGRSIASKVSSRSPTTGWRSCLCPVRWKRTLWAAHRVRKSRSGWRAHRSVRRGSGRRGCDRLRSAAWRRCRRRRGPSRWRTRGAGVEVDEAGGVGGAGAASSGGTGRSPAVGGEQVVPGVAHPGRRVGHRVEDLLHARRDTRFPAPARPRGSGFGRAGEVEQVGAFRVVQLQRPGHALRTASEAPARLPRSIRT